MQNKSHAVMSQRTEPLNSLDDFPTPPWATRALLEHVLTPFLPSLADARCLEPACGAGHMSKVLMEYFGEVRSRDVRDYGYGEVRDFLANEPDDENWDWIITNPPFRLAEEFVLRALSLAQKGVAILARTVFVESVGRYENLFKHTPPAIYAQFSERVPMLRGRLEKGATTATSYCWLVWDKSENEERPHLVWIPPCRRRLEKESDYHQPQLRLVAENPR